MSRRCSITGVGVQAGNNVSHSNRRTRRRFLPNIQKVSVLSDALGHTVTLSVTAATVRTLEHNGGLDSYLLNTKVAQLTADAKRLKKRVQKALEKKVA